MVKVMLKLFVCVLATGLSAGIANADIDAGLVAHWPFEEDGGTATADVTGNGHDGTLVGGAFWATGPVGCAGALSFNVAERNHVGCGNFNPASASGELTIALWANHDAAGMGGDTARTMVSKRGSDDYHMFQFFIHTPSNYIRLHRKSESEGFAFCEFHNTESIEATMPTDEWTHLVVTLDGTYARLYINGDFYAATQWNMGDPDDDLVRIGEINTACSNQSFNGIMDEVRLYNRVLDADDVLLLYEFISDPDYNAPPTVDAGDYQSLLWQAPSVTVQLDATVSDDGKPGSPLTYAWSQLGGSGVIFSDPGIEAPTATFPAAGMYELQLSVSDGEKDSCDVVTIWVRANNDPIARWNFEEGDGTTVGDSSAYDNIGTWMGGEPNWVPGWIGNWAMKCSAGSYTSIAVDTAADPNLDTQQYEVTVSAWVKVDEWLSSSWDGIVTKGKGNGTPSGYGGWLLMRNSSNNSLAFSTPGAGIVRGSVNVKDGNWHHVAGVHNGVTISLYVDGVLDTSAEATGLVLPKTAKIWINGNSEPEEGDELFFDGMVDDVHIYGYGLSDVQVADLAAMGALIPAVDAGMDDTFYVRNGFYQLAATVTDDGKPEPVTLAWTQTSGPGVAQFSNAAIESPTVTFSEVGTYELCLTANDTLAQISDVVIITVEDPVCQDVIDGGLLVAGDVSGPEGIPDCRVNLYDFAAIASDWLNCNDPQNLGCDFPYI